MAALLRLPAVEARTGLRRSSIYERIQRGAFPKPVKLGPRCSAWCEDELNDWIEARRAERDAEGEPPRAA